MDVPVNALWWQNCIYHDTDLQFQKILLTL